MRNPPVNMLLLLPEPALELQADLARIHIGNGVDGAAGVGRKVMIDIAEYGQRNGTDTEVGFQAPLAAFVLVYHLHSLLCIMDGTYFRMVVDENPQLFPKSLRYPVHSA